MDQAFKKAVLFVRFASNRFYKVYNLFTLKHHLIPLEDTIQDDEDSGVMDLSAGIIRVFT